MQNRYLSEPAGRGAEQMLSDSTEYESLYTELTDYEKSGVCILMDGKIASPLQVVKAYIGSLTV